MLALPLIFEAITGAPKLFDAALSVFNAVTGKPSNAEVPAVLQAEVEALTPEQQQAFASKMESAIKMYEAETDRLEVQGGRIDENITSKLSQTAADEIAMMRMMTRPMIARMMARGMVWPLMSLFAVDIALAFVNTICAGLAVTVKHGTDDVLLKFQLISGQFFGADSVYTTMYGQFVIPAAAIIGGYMTLRQFEKTKGDASPVDAISGAMSGLAGLIKGIRR